jgi:hypothetical protein
VSRLGLRALVMRTRRQFNRLNHQSAEQCPERLMGQTKIAAELRCRGGLPHNIAASAPQAKPFLLADLEKQIDISFRERLAALGVIAKTEKDVRKLQLSRAGAITAAQKAMTATSPIRIQGNRSGLCRTAVLEGCWVRLTARKGTEDHRPSERSWCAIASPPICDFFQKPKECEDQTGDSPLD